MKWKRKKKTVYYWETNKLSGFFSKYNWIPLALQHKYHGILYSYTTHWYSPLFMSRWDSLSLLSKTTWCYLIWWLLATKRKLFFSNFQITNSKTLHDGLIQKKGEERESGMTLGRIWRYQAQTTNLYELIWL